MIKEMAVAFLEISSEMAKFEKMDPNSLQLLKGQRKIVERLACCKNIYDEKKEAISCCLLISL
jgi:hypothetical protein